METVRDGAALRTPWAAIAGVIATVSVFAIAQGLSYPLFTFLMQQQGMSAGMIGLSAAMTPLGLIASAPFVPLMARRLGARRLAVGCAILAALLFLLVGFLQNGFAWFVLRFFIGVVIDALYVLSEVWMLALAPPSRRGRVMGIYTAIIGAGFAAGPLSLVLVGTAGWPPFAIAIAAFLGCALCLQLVSSRLPSMDDGTAHVPLGSFVALAPTLLLAVVVTAAFEQSVLALLPVYGTAYGIPERVMAALLAAMIAGNIALQIPLGLLAERLTPRLVMLACAGLSVVGTALLPAAIETVLVWPMLFVLGAVSYGIYTMSLIELGNRFSGQALIAGNAAFALMWGVGGIAGPPGAGVMMEFLGVQGLPLTLGLMCAVLVAFGIYRSRMRGDDGA